MYEISRQGLKAVVHFEGAKKTVYKDVAGLQTIGVGHLLTPAELASGQLTDIPPMWRHGLSDDEVIELLDVDIQKFVKGINNLIQVRLYQREFDALVSWSFNVGLGAAKDSNLVYVLNRSMYANIPLELAKWTKAGGKTSQGLANRRTAESAIWTKGEYPS